MYIHIYTYTVVASRAWRLVDLLLLLPHLALAAPVVHAPGHDQLLQESHSIKIIIISSSSSSRSNSNSMVVVLLVPLTMIVVIIVPPFLKIRRRRVFRASVPGEEQHQKLLSLGP